MKILYVCADPGIPIGGTKGASIHVEEVRRALVLAGHHVVLLARNVEHPPRRAVVERCPALSPALRRVAPWLDSAMLARACAAAIGKHRPDFVYERYALGAPEAGEAARRAGVPVVLEVNAPLVEEAARFRGVPATTKALVAQRQQWRAADLVVVVSEHLAEAVEDAGQRHVLVAPNAVDATVFRPLDGSALRTRLGLDGRFVVAFAGTVRPWHDMSVVLAALSLLPRVLRPVLLVVGDASRLPRGYDVDVVRAGPVPHDEVPALLAAADVCVAPLSADPALTYFSPLKALEYLACGLATVVADADGLSALAEAGAAVAYRPGAAADLTRVLEQLAANPERRAALGAHGRSYAASRTWNDVAVRVVEALALGRQQPEPAPTLTL